MTPVFAHLDMDSFFVSVERLLNPELVGKPVIVGGPPESRGVVSCASYEARAFGVHSAMPSAVAKRLCPKAVFVWGEHSHYGNYSNKVHQLLKDAIPEVEAASIDEFYLNLTGCERLFGHPETYCTHIWKRIHDEIGLPSSIGIAPNRSVSKIASKVAKPDGIKYVPKEDVHGFLDPLPVDLLSGVGSVTLKKLQAFNIRTIGQLRGMDRRFLIRVFGKHGEDLHKKAHGVHEGTVITYHTERKQMSHEMTFQEDLYDPAILLEKLQLLVERLCYRLRSKQLHAKHITLKVRYSDFKTVTQTTSFEPANTDPIIFLHAKELLQRMVNRRVRVRLLGVSLGKLEVATGQLSLFETPKNQRFDALYQSVDQLRKRYGYDIVYAGTFDKRVQKEPASASSHPR